MSHRLFLILPAVMWLVAAHAATPGPSPEAIIADTYDRYQADPDTLDDDMDLLDEPPFFEPEMEALYVAGTQDRGDDLPVVDWDVFVNGQDVRITNVHIASHTGSDGTVTVTARFDNFGEHQTVVYDFVRLPEGWRCTDLHYPPGEYFPDGFSLKAWITEGLAAPP